MKRWAVTSNVLHLALESRILLFEETDSVRAVKGETGWDGVRRGPVSVSAREVELCLAFSPLAASSHRWKRQLGASDVAEVLETVRPLGFLSLIYCSGGVVEKQEYPWWLYCAVMCTHCCAVNKTRQRCRWLMWSGVRVTVYAVGVLWGCCNHGYTVEYALVQ